MSGKWDDRERKLDDECDAHGGAHNHGGSRRNGHDHNHGGDDGGNDGNNRKWTPRHHDTRPPDDNTKKIYSVTEASRLHKGANISVIGVISGIQPLRKMIKGMSVQCMKCNTVYERKYDKPELFESYVPVERINKCTNENCKTRDYLGHFNYDHINAVIVELKDTDTFSEIDPLRIIVFGDDEPNFDDTINIVRHIGEPVIVTGDIYNVDIGKKRESRVVAYLYVKYMIKYLSKQEVELSSEDVKAIKRFVTRIGPDNIVDKLSQMFATSIIGNNYVKKGLLLVAASTSLDKTLKKLHAILVGDPGLAKSRMLKEAVGLVPNSRYESVQFATGKSLTVIVTKEEGDALILRIGPIAQAKGAIAALNELSSMNHEDQKYMLDTQQEQGFTTNKFGQNFYVDAPTAIIASANPVGGSWKSNYDGEAVNLDKIPMIKPLIDRFDLIFAFKDNRDENILADYAFKKSEMEDRPTPDYTAYLVKHIMYAKQRYPKPRFSEEAKDMLNQYYVSIRVKYGSPRILETIYRIAQNIARLKLKNIVDAVDAKETVQFYNFILQQLDMVVASPANPRDVVYEECLDILMRSKFAISFEELVNTACQRNKQVERYIGKSFRLDENSKLRPILDMLRNHSRIKEVQMRPVVLQYMHYDHYDLSDLPQDTTEENFLDENTPKNISEVSEPRSERSFRSDSNNPRYIPGQDGNGNGFLKCYWCAKVGSSFQTNIEEEYQRHGTQKHHNKPMYPNLATIDKYKLKPQGRDWEV